MRKRFKWISNNKNSEMLLKMDTFCLFFKGFNCKLLCLPQNNLSYDLKFILRPNVDLMLSLIDHQTL